MFRIVRYETLTLRSMAKQDEGMAHMAESSQRNAHRITWEGDPNPPWLKTPLPNSLKDREHLYQLFDFFLVQSPCRFQSNRRRSIEETWGIGGKLSDRSMKEHLDTIVFGGTSDVLIKDSKKNLARIAVDRNLENDFYLHLNRQIAAYTQTSNRGNANTYMSFFYHLRNSLAHGRFAILDRTDGKQVFLFEDGQYNKHREIFSLNARGVIELNSLLLIIDTILHNPPERIDEEQLVFSAIKNGLKTKGEIIDSLQIEEECWRQVTQNLKKKKLITYANHTWHLRDEHPR